VRDVTARAFDGSTARRVAEPALIVGALAVGLLAAVVAARPGGGYGGAAIVAPALAATAIVAGIVLHRPRRAVSWALVAVGCAVQVVATAALVAQAQEGPPDRTGLWQAIAVLAYPAFAVGVAGVTTRRESGWFGTPTTAIGATVVGTGVLSLAFLLPEVARDELPFAESDWVGLLALADVMVAVIAVRRAVGSPRRNWTPWLLTAGFIAWGNAHAEIGVRLFDDTYDKGSAVLLLLAVGPLLVGLAALLPSMYQVPEPRPGAEGPAGTAGWARWLVISAALVVHGAEVDLARLWIIVPALVVVTVAVGWTASLVAQLGDPERPSSGRAPTSGSGTGTRTDPPAGAPDRTPATRCSPCGSDGGSRPGSS
jgi:hypothetical protein